MENVDHKMENKTPFKSSFLPPFTWRVGETKIIPNTLHTA